jgi:hypothetical protein
MISWVMRGCVVLMAALCFYTAWEQAGKNAEFDRQGEKALIQPFSEYTETTTVRTKLGIEVGRDVSQSAVLEFTTAAGDRVAVNRKLPKDVFEKFSAGQPVYMEYLRERPSINRFEGHPAQPLITALLGLAFAVGGWFFWKRM